METFTIKGSTFTLESRWSVMLQSWVTDLTDPEGFVLGSVASRSEAKELAKAFLAGPALAD